VKLKVMVVANEYGAVGTEAVRQRLADMPGDIEVEVSSAIEVGPMPPKRELVHDEDGNLLPEEVQGSRQFFLWRETDVTEVTVPADGEARCVATGVQFPDGQCALWWAPPGAGDYDRPRTSVAVWPSIEALKEVHLQPRSETKLVWIP
jgi:hypothetical protein